MSLNQKYTWADFLKENPDHKEKKTKRTSAEGKKAFEAAYKKFIKGYLAQRHEQLGRMEQRTNERREKLTATVKRFQKAKDFSKVAFYQKKVGMQDAALADIKQQMESAKAAAKKL